MTAGVSVLFDNGFVGASGRGFESEYGIQEIELEPAGAPPGAQAGSRQPERPDGTGRLIRAVSLGYFLRKVSRGTISA